MAEFINKTMRKVIKNTVYSAQAVIFVGQMPRPMDFVKRIVGDLVYLSAQVNKMVTDVNKMLDDYGDIPTNYILVQIDSLSNSANNLVDRVNTYATETIRSGSSLTQDKVNMMQTSLDDTISNVNETTKTVSKLSTGVAKSNSDVLSQDEISSGIKSSTSAIYQWTGDQFNYAQSSIDNINATTTKLANNAISKVNNVTSSVTNAISSKQQAIHDLVNKLKSYIDKLGDDIDSGFSGVTGINNLSSATSKLGSDLTGDGFEKSIATASQNISKALDSFSIAKVIKASGGILVTTALVKSGLNELPPVDFESMLDNIVGSQKETDEEILKKLDYEAGDLLDVIDDLKEYDDETYTKFKKQFDEDIKAQRDKIRLALKNRPDNKPLTAKEKSEIKSAIKETRKLKKLAKKGRKSTKFKDIINEELNKFKEQCTFRFDNITSSWNQMMSQYQKSIDNINKYFKKDGEGSKYIDKLCDDMNKQYNEIIELCKNIGSQLIASSIKVGVPADVGMVFPNPVYKLSSFWMDVKTIISFIFNIIKCVIKILKDIWEIAKLILTALTSLDKIMKDLKEFFCFDWLLSLIGNIINVFNEKTTDAKVSIMNTLSPIYYRDTEEYSNTLEIFNNMISSGYINARPYYKELRDSSRIRTISISPRLSDEDDFEEIIEDFKNSGDDIIAYKSPILKKGEEVEIDINNIEDIDKLNLDVEFIGWHFFHPNLDHTDYFSNMPFGKIFKNIKNEIIVKAAERGNRKDGGVNMLNNSWVVNNKARAYNAFYWYTIYTTDIEKDCFDNKVKQDSIIVEPISTTENGSIVQLEDGRRVFVKSNMIKSGDYVTVEGVKYRVK